MMTTFKRRIALLLTLITIPCSAFADNSNNSPSPLPVNDTTNMLSKSLTDTNDYYLITLPNHLNVMLVSDPKAQRFAASLSVKIGSFQDPVQQQGLAHLLEHMLFLGTKKYPEAGDYQSYISIHGGFRNAYTSTNTTNFYFDIKPSAYEGALDRFSQFFSAPLLSESLTQREKNAVDSEYKAKFKDESRRSNQAFKTLLNPKHPYSQFSVGNLETLKDRPNNPLRKQLLKLYKNYYFADNMALVLVANLPYSQLKALAQEYFSAIPSRTVKPNTTYPALIAPGHPQLQFLRPLVDSNTLTFYYQIDAQSKYYKTKPTRYLSYILGNENKGSLYASLKKDGLINGISASTSQDYGNNAFFIVKIRLTNDGMRKIDEVASRFFATVSMLKSSPINSTYLQEGLILSKLMSDYRNYVDPQTLAKTLSPKMLEVPVEDTLNSFHIEKVASEEQIHHLLKQLNTENLLTQVASQQALPEQWANSPLQWQTEPWYQSQYSNNRFRQAFLDKINLAVKSIHVSLPQRNQFIPQSLDMITEKDEIPTIVFKQQGFTYWNKSDASFNKPTAMNFLALRFSHAADTPEHALLNRLWCRLFNDSISESTYAPYVAGLGFSFYPHANGVTLRTNGYSDKQANYLTWLIDQLFLFRPTQSHFDLAKQQLAKDLANQKNRQAYRNANTALNTLITKHSFTTKQLQSALEHLTLEELRSFSKHARENFDLVGFSTGNISHQQSIHLAQSIYQRFADRLSPKQPVKIETKTLAAKQRLHYRFDSTSRDSVVLFAIIDTSTQNLDTDSQEAIKEKAYFSILQRLINSRFYHELRTTQQLGYIVGAQNLSTRNTPILGLLVQSPNKDSATLIKAIEHFLSEQKSQMTTLSNKAFDNAKNALLDELNMQAKNLADNALGEWHQIAKQTPNFKRKEEWLTAVTAIQRKDFIDFVKDKIQAGNTTRIIIHNQPIEAELLNTQKWLAVSPSSQLNKPHNSDSNLPTSAPQPSGSAAN